MFHPNQLRTGEALSLIAEPGRTGACLVAGCTVQGRPDRVDPPGRVLRRRRSPVGETADRRHRPGTGLADPHLRRSLTIMSIHPARVVASLSSSPAAFVVGVSVARDRPSPRSSSTPGLAVRPADAALLDDLVPLAAVHRRLRRSSTSSPALGLLVGQGAGPTTLAIGIGRRGRRRRGHRAAPHRRRARSVRPRPLRAPVHRRRHRHRRAASRSSTSPSSSPSARRGRRVARRQPRRAGVMTAGADAPALRPSARDPRVRRVRHAPGRARRPRRRRGRPADHEPRSTRPSSRGSSPLTVAFGIAHVVAAYGLIRRRDLERGAWSATSPPSASASRSTACC